MPSSHPLFRQDSAIEGGHAEELGHFVAFDGLQDSARRHPVGVGDHGDAGIEGGDVSLPDRAHEAEFAGRQHDVAGREFHVELDDVAERDHPALRVQDTLGVAGGARRIAHEGGIEGVRVGRSGSPVRRRLQVLVGEFPGRRPGGAVQNHQVIEAARLQEIAQGRRHVLHGKGDARFAVAKDVLHLLRPQQRVGHHGNGAEFPAGQRADAVMGMVAASQQDHVAALDAEVLQARRDTVYLGLELLVREGAAVPDHGAAIA